MATPYLQIRQDEVPSTQDLAREALDDLPVAVIAKRQTAGRGRSGSEWVTAPRALAVSVAFRTPADDMRPISLMAGVAAARALGTIRLKWPNDLVVGRDKVGGILVERSDVVVVVGLGLNLWWPESPDGVSHVCEAEPSEHYHAEIGGLWVAELMSLARQPGWPIREYRDLCDTLGRAIEWEPDGSGNAVDVDDEGALIVETSGGTESIVAGAVRHITG